MITAEGGDEVPSPLVSIIMNCYNSDRFLNEAIDSVYAQTYTNWEIIFWDNASTDNSAQIAKSYDNKIKYFLADETTPLGEARVLAVQQAKGDYLAFLDCDDLWLPKKLEQQMDIFMQNHDGPALVYGRCEFFYSDRDKKSYLLRDGQTLPEGKVFRPLAQDNFIPFLSAVVDHEKYVECGGFPSHLKHSPDYWLFIHLAKKYRIRALQDVCCRHRTHGDNLTHDLILTAAHESIEIVSQFLPDKDAEDGLKYQHVKLIFACLKEGHYTQALYMFARQNCRILFIKELFRRLAFRLMR